MLHGEAAKTNTLSYEGSVHLVVHPPKELILKIQFPKWIGSTRADSPSLLCVLRGTQGGGEIFISHGSNGSLQSRASWGRCVTKLWRKSLVVSAVPHASGVLHDEN